MSPAPAAILSCTSIAWGRSPEVIGCLDETGVADVFSDAGILEIFTGGRYGAWRLPSIA